MGVRIFGCHLAELIVGLRARSPREATPPEAQRHIDQLYRDFGNFRKVLQNGDTSLAAALIEPVVQRFSEDLSHRDMHECHGDLSERAISYTIRSRRAPGLAQGLLMCGKFVSGSGPCSQTLEFWSA